MKTKKKKEENFSEQEGKKLVLLARKAIEYYNLTSFMYSSSSPEKKFTEKKGVFITINSYPEKELLGCIGLPYPKKPVWDAVIEAATHASRDPRFDPVNNQKLENSIIELTILSNPTKIKNKETAKIETGKHGLIIKRKFKSGLLLPQVGSQYNWDSKTLLEQTCLKAGLPRNAWKLPDAEIFIFSGSIFKEKNPKGKVIKTS